MKQLRLIICLFVFSNLSAQSSEILKPLINKTIEDLSFGNLTIGGKAYPRNLLTSPFTSQDKEKIDGIFTFVREYIDKNASIFNKGQFNNLTFKIQNLLREQIYSYLTSNFKNVTQYIPRGSLSQIEWIEFRTKGLPNSLIKPELLKLNEEKLEKICAEFSKATIKFSEELNKIKQSLTSQKYLMKGDQNCKEWILQLVTTLQFFWGTVRNDMKSLYKKLNIDPKKCSVI